MPRLASALAGAACLVTAPIAGAEASETLVTIDTRPGVKQDFLLLSPKKPVAAVILFPGGHGRLKLAKKAKMNSRNFGANFLVRSRLLIADQGFLTVTFDAPSDRQGKLGMLDGFRAGADHCVDVAAVVKHLKSVANVPVWLVGTSRGSESAANCAIRLNGQIGGVVLTSSVSRSNKKGYHVLKMPLDKITVPALVVAHEKDGCEVTPPGDAPKIVEALRNARRKALKMMQGGDPPTSNACGNQSAHGFLGVEVETIKAIADFIRH